ncbi:MAG: GGDEF domain-containing protein [Pseudomonadales bacterium]|nr:GGDEF domain-containing protein [Pseudomonadales bacterium]
MMERKPIMATPLQTSNTIDFNSARLSLSKPQPSLSETIREDYSERRYRMATSLQSTLDVEQLLQLFLGELKSSVELDGLQYINENQKLQIVTGRKASHSCGYRLITANDHLGEIVFYRNTRFSDQHLQAIEVMLSALICPLRNALTYRDAIMASLTDPLTGAGNRIAMDNALEREINLARRFKQPLSVLVMDIDKFKQINDQYGHGAGDAVLKSIVSTITKINRNTDLTFRYGGDELVVLLNRTNADGALVIAERLRKAVKALEIPVGDEMITTSISIGATSFTAQDSAESIFNRADKALYLIKSEGGNKVIGL